MLDDFYKILNTNDLLLILSVYSFLDGASYYITLNRIYESEAFKTLKSLSSNIMEYVLSMFSSNPELFYSQVINLLAYGANISETTLGSIKINESSVYLKEKPISGSTYSFRAGYNGFSPFFLGYNPYKEANELAGISHLYALANYLIKGPKGFKEFQKFLFECLNWWRECHSFIGNPNIRQKAIDQTYERFIFNLINQMPSEYIKLLPPLIVKILKHVSNKDKILSKLPSELLPLISEYEERERQINSVTSISKINECVEWFSKK